MFFVTLVVKDCLDSRLHGNDNAVHTLVSAACPVQSDHQQVSLTNDVVGHKANNRV